MYKYGTILGILFMLCWSQGLGQKTAQEYLVKGDYFYDLGNFDSSIIMLKAGIKLNQKNELNQTSADLYWRLGSAYKMVEQFPKAFTAYKKSELLNTKIGSQLGLANVYVSMIEYYRKRVNFEKADEYIALTLNLQQKINFPELLDAKFYSRCAAVEMEYRGDISKSLEYSNRVLKIANKLNDPQLKITALNEIGFAYENKGEGSVAAEKYLLALKFSDSTTDYSSKINVLSNLGRCYTKMQKFKEAISFYEKALQLCEEHTIETPKIDIYFNLIRLYQELKDYKNAFEALTKYTGAYQKDIIEKNEKSIVELEKKYDLEKQTLIADDAMQRASLAEKKARLEKGQVYTWILVSMLLFFLISIITVLVIRLNKNNRLLKQTNIELSSTIDQKDTVFKELHHRVKNNLTMLKSILFLHAKSSDDDNVIKVLQDCQSRIDSMAIVHQNLYEVDDTTRVNLNQFLNTLIGGLEDVFLPANKKVNVNIQDNNITVDMSRAVFLGIIFNEMVTNSFKYASSADKQLSIGIEVIGDEDNLRIIYWDNGDGLPSDEFEFENGGFGFKLIQIMIRQLNSELNYSKIDGRPTFSFKIQKEAR